MIFNAQEERWSRVEDLPAHRRRIDVWWWDDATSRLMLLFAYLMTRRDEWSEARIRVLAPTARKGAKRNLENLNRTLADVRISAEPEVIVEPSLEAIVEQCADAAFAFLPLHVRGNRLVSPLGAAFDEILSRVPLGALVIAAEDIDLEAEPEEGRPGKIAAALDAAAEADKRAQEKEGEAAKAAEFAEEKRGEMKRASETDRSEDERKEIKAAFKEAEKAAERTAQEAKEARSDADEAAKAADQLMKQPEGANKAEPAEQAPKKKNKTRGKPKKGKREAKK